MLLCTNMNGSKRSCAAGIHTCIHLKLLFYIWYNVVKDLFSSSKQRVITDTHKHMKQIKIVLFWPFYTKGTKLQIKTYTLTVTQIHQTYMIHGAVLSDAVSCPNFSIVEHNIISHYNLHLTSSLMEAMLFKQWAKMAETQTVQQRFFQFPCSVWTDLLSYKR